MQAPKCLLFRVDACVSKSKRKMCQRYAKCRAPRQGRAIFGAHSDIEREAGESRDRRLMGQRSAASQAPSPARTPAASRQKLQPPGRAEATAQAMLSCPSHGDTLLKHRGSPQPCCQVCYTPLMSAASKGLCLMQRAGGAPRFDPTQYVQEQRERRRLLTARLHQGLPAADTRSRSRPRARTEPSLRSGEAFRVAHSSHAGQERKHDVRLARRRIMLHQSWHLL